jgi:hypothetical protein
MRMCLYIFSGFDLVKVNFSVMTVKPQGPIIFFSGEIPNRLYYIQRLPIMPDNLFNIEPLEDINTLSFPRATLY